MNAWKEGWVVEWMDESQVSGWQDPDPPSGASHLGAEQLLALGNQGTVVELEGPPIFQDQAVFVRVISGKLCGMHVLLWSLVGPLL